MSSVNLAPINTLNLKMKYGTLSNYAKNFVKSQLKSVKFALKNFFLDVDSKLISENEQKLREIGVKHVGKDMKEGVLISGDEYDYHVFSSDGKIVGFDILESDNNQVYRHFSLSEKSNEYLHAGDYSGLNIEDEMGKIIDFVGYMLIKARRVCVAKVPQPFIPNKTTSDKINKLNSVLCGLEKPTDIKTVGYIGLKEAELLDSIREKLRLIQDLYMKISDGRTKWEVKKAYENYMPQPVANKVGFKNIGPNGESICLFNSSYKNSAHTAIIVTEANGKELNFVISQDKRSVQKNLPSKYVRSENSGYRIYFAPNYYTQKEIDESNLDSYLSCLNEELSQFIKYTQGWFIKKEERILVRLNSDIATLDQYNEILSDIHSSFENYRIKMRKYLRKSHKSKNFKAENNISTKLASTAVKFDKLTPEGYDLRLSYPKIHGHFATQLLVMRDDKIEKSFYILDNKLLRLDIRDLNDKFNHYDRKLYYYDKKYLEDSNLSDYLPLLQNKLHELNEKLDAIRVKQIENRIKYHIRPSKEKSGNLSNKSEKAKR